MSVWVWMEDAWLLLREVGGFLGAGRDLSQAVGALQGADYGVDWYPIGQIPPSDSSFCLTFQLYIPTTNPNFLVRLRIPRWSVQILQHKFFFFHFEYCILGCEYASAKEYVTIFELCPVFCELCQISISAKGLVFSFKGEFLFCIFVVSLKVWNFWFWTLWDWMLFWRWFLKLTVSVCCRNVFGVLVLQWRQLRRALEFVGLRLWRELWVTQVWNHERWSVPRSQRGETKENSEHALQKSFPGSKSIFINQKDKNSTKRNNTIFPHF